MRKPLMAGNWKMNLNHLEAIAVAQKLVYSLNDKDYDAVDVTIIPPFTDIRSIQTLIDGDRLRLTYGAQDLSPEASGAFTDTEYRDHLMCQSRFNLSIHESIANRRFENYRQTANLILSS